MKAKVKVDPMGDIGATKNGFIRQFVALDATGSKSVIKLFSKVPEKLDVASGAEIVITTQEFCFVD